MVTPTGSKDDPSGGIGFKDYLAWVEKKQLKGEGMYSVSGLDEQRRDGAAGSGSGSANNGKGKERAVEGGSGNGNNLMDMDVEMDGIDDDIDGDQGEGGVSTNGTNGMSLAGFGAGMGEGGVKREDFVRVVLQALRDVGYRSVFPYENPV